MNWEQWIAEVKACSSIGLSEDEVEECRHLFDNKICWEDAVDFLVELRSSSMSRVSSMRGEGIEY